MITVPFIQFHRPDGRQSKVEIDLPDEIRPHLEQIKQCGCRLTAEMLPAALVSFCIEEPRLGDVEQQICQNGPAVPETIVAMLKRFSLERFEEFKQQLA
jgi:hypothetical protein